jgi:Schlafen, AlbA_2
LACEDHPDEYIFIQNVTEAPLIPKCNTDLNVIILIGLLRWRLGMKRHEIRAFLVTKGIYLSTGTISNRSLDFLLLFKQLHKNKCEEIKALIECKGGIIFIGVSDKNNIKGIKVGKETLNQWTNQISQSTDPRIIPELEKIKVDGKTVIAVKIKENPIKNLL